MASLAFLLNPVVDEPSKSVGHALAVLACHRKRPSLERYKDSLSPTKRRKPTPTLSPVVENTAKALELTTVPCRRHELCSPSSASESASDHEALAKKSRPKRVRVRVSTPCIIDGCTNLAVTKGCCVRHGGGARCEFQGCEKRAKKNKRCFTHGGCAQCQHDQCTSKAKRYGFCWAHGGGKFCTVEGCGKVGGQGGLCWAHGGGSRCRIAHCTRRSYQKDDYLCGQHASAAVV